MFSPALSQGDKITVNVYIFAQLNFLAFDGIFALTNFRGSSN